ncbi:MAG: protein kinase domain-containing protein [Planctomycetota bacterium]|jgi:WD40 repeat protein/serine/threonine protein kinase
MSTQLTVEEIFYTAREKSDPAERAGYLDDACGDDESVRSQVDALLKADATAGMFLAEGTSCSGTGATKLQPGSRITSRTPIAWSEHAGEMIGRYKLLQQIGEGGFGVVYMAEQCEPVKRRVALKVIKLGMDTKQVIARFEAERQALAMMDHPNIAKVLDAGSTDGGRPYFVMEYIKGVPILEYCDNGRIDTALRLELFRTVCHAIQHAHQKGVIHRDIKPSNVLVTMHDGVPVPRVIDFGIAKATNVELTTRTLFTEHRQMIGTPAYMSPEQAEMSELDIDTRSDIYSLGVLLYELLTGTTPFNSKELTSKGFVEMLRIIREVEPPRPSTRLESLGDTGTRAAEQRSAADSKKLGQTLKGDLDWIVMKCLEKDRARRYETPNGLAMDIGRYLAGEAVLAAPPSAAYQVWKFIRRNRGSVIAGSAVIVTLLMGIVGTTMGLLQARSARIDADREAEHARQASAVALHEKTVAQHQAYSANMLGAFDALERGQIDSARNFLNRAPSELRGWEWRHLSSRLDPSLRTVELKAQISQLHVAPDGRSYYGVGQDLTRTVQRWDMETGMLLETIPTDRPCWSSWLVANGTQLVMHLSDVEFGAGTVEAWNLASRVRIASWPVPSHFQVAPNGEQAAFVREDELHVLDLRTGEVRVVPANGAGDAKGWGSTLCFQPDGRRMAVEWSIGQVRLIDVDSLQVLSTFDAHKNILTSLAFSPDASRLMSTSSIGPIRITDVGANPPALLQTLRAHDGSVWDAGFSPDGSLLVSRGQDRTVRLWDLQTGRARGVLQLAGDEPGPTAFLPDSRTLISVDAEGTIQFWNTHADDEWVLHGHHSYVYPVLVSPDGATVYSGGWDGFVNQPGCLRIWDAASGDAVGAIGAADTYALAAAISPDGSRLALSLIVVGGPPRIYIIDTATGATIAKISEPEMKDPDGGIASVAFDPDGGRLAWINGQGHAVIADSQTGTTLLSRPLCEETERWPRLAWSPDGATIATCHEVKGVLRLWDATNLEPIRQWPLGHLGPTTSVAFSPDSRRIVTAAYNGIARIWDSTTGTLVHELSGRGKSLLSARYSPDGRRIATGGYDKFVWLWDAQTFEPVARLGGHEAYIFWLAWRADSQMLVSGSGDHTVRIWDTQTLRDRTQARRERWDIVARIEPMVQSLFNELGDATRVAEHVKADPSLTPRARQIALQLVLAAATKARPSTLISSEPALVETP